MGKTFKRLLVIALITLFASQGSVNALSIADNSELYTDSLTKEDVVAIHNMDYLRVSLRYQTKDGGSFNCEPNKPFDNCNFEEGELHNVYENVGGKARVYELKNGKKIVSIKAISSNPGLGTFTIQQEYSDALLSEENRAKIVSTGYDFIYGTNLNTSTTQIKQRSNYTWFTKTATISSLRLGLSTPKRTLGLGHWRDVGNVRVAIMTYKRFKIIY